MQSIYKKYPTSQSILSQAGSSIFEGTAAMNQIICDAINNKKCLAIQYGGFDRVIEPHAYGLTKEGHEVMRIWQIRGGSRSGKMPPWRLFRLDETHAIQILDEIAQTPRPSYRRGDKSMRVIYCQV